MKYLLDTCVISDLIKPTPDESVVEWFSQIPDEDLYLSSVVIGEIAQGLEALPSSRRRRVYENWFHESVEIAYAGRILAYDATAAKRWATIMATAAAKGHPRPAMDAMVAAIASVHGMAVATRNISHLGLCIALKWCQLKLFSLGKWKKFSRTRMGRLFISQRFGSNGQWLANRRKGNSILRFEGGWSFTGTLCLCRCAFTGEC